MPLCLLKGLVAGGLGLAAAVDLASVPEESEEVEDPEPKEKRDLLLPDCELWVFANGEPLVVLLDEPSDELDQRLETHPGVAMVVEEEPAESREEVRKRFIVPRVRISSVEKERPFRVERRRLMDFPSLFGGDGERVGADLSMEDVGVKEWELPPEREVLERLKG